VRDERLEGVSARAVNRFLNSLSPEHQLTVLTELVARWAAHGHRVLVITDGDVLYPDQPPPYDVLWLLPSGTVFPFTPRYGRVVRMD